MPASRVAQKFVSSKIRKIKEEGVRGRAVSQRQAIAIALSMARKKGLKVGKPKKRSRHNRRYFASSDGVVKSK